MQKITLKPARSFAALFVVATGLGIVPAAMAEDDAGQSATPASPSEIVNTAPQEDWQVIAPEDLLVMRLTPDDEGNQRQVIIQLMPAPFSQGWVENIRMLARAHWYDGISVNRVQDNYVVQWGDPGHDNPESGETETKALPDGLNVMSEAEYTSPSLYPTDHAGSADTSTAVPLRAAVVAAGAELTQPLMQEDQAGDLGIEFKDRYAGISLHAQGWPIAGTGVPSRPEFWPVHCYGMVGVGRNYSPDTGSGAELYTVIGHAPRHLDRNIAVVGRIISGMEHLSSLPRGSGVLGFYTEEEAHKRTPIQWVRLASSLAEDARPQFEYLSTESESFARYAEARANRRDPFFIYPAGGADICNIPVPIRAFEYAEGGE